MRVNKSRTSSIYVVYKNKVLLHRHKKYNTLFPLGGKVSEEEVPHQTAIMEVYEGSGLEVENIDFIYFARAFSSELRPQKGESKELYWFTKEEIESNDNIKTHVKVMALDVLGILSNI